MTKILPGGPHLVSVGKIGSKVSIVPLRQKDDGKSETLIGFSYHRYELEKETVIDNMTTEHL